MTATMITGGALWCGHRFYYAYEYESDQYGTYTRCGMCDYQLMQTAPGVWVRPKGGSK